MSLTKFPALNGAQMPAVLRMLRRCIYPARLAPIFFHRESCDYRQVVRSGRDIGRVMTGYYTTPYYAARGGRWTVFIWLVGIVTLAAIPVTFLASGARAAFMDGELLHRLCENSPSEAAAYSIGIADSLQWIEDAQDDPENLDIRLCIPGNVGAWQIKEATCKYLAEHPESLQLPAATLVGLALYGKWLCRS